MNFAGHIQAYLIIAVAMAYGCDGQIDSASQQLTKNEFSATIKVSFLISSITPQMGKSGDKIILTGTGFSPGMSLQVNGAAIDSFDVADETQLTFTIPEGNPGLKNLVLASQGKEIAYPFVQLANASDRLVVVGSDLPEELCAGPTYFNMAGEEVTGTRNCDQTTVEHTQGSTTPIPLCSKDGEINCVATAAFSSAQTDLLAAKVRAGETVAGIPGKYVPDFPDPANVSVADTVNGRSGTIKTCDTDGEVACITATTFRAADTAAITGDKILAGSTIGGISGTAVTAGFTTCVADGAMDCVTTARFKSADTLAIATADVRFGRVVAGVAGSLADCTEGSSGCVVVGPTFAAAVKSGLPSKVLFGETVAGVAGNVTLPGVGKVLTGTAYGVLGTGNIGTLTLPGAGNVLATSGTFGDPSVAVTPTLTLPIPANVKAGSSTYGNPTSLLTPSFSPDFPAVANVYNDTVDGVAGTLVLPAVGDVFTGIAYGPPGTSSTGTLTLASAANVRTSNGLFGRSGNSIMPTLADCADAASGCFVVGPLQVTATVAGSADKILSGQTVGGIAGNITLPAVGKVFSGIQYGVLGTSKTGTLTLPTATNVLAESGPYGDPAALLTPSLTEDFPDVGNVLASDTVNNIAGTLTLPAAGNVLAASGTYGNPTAAVTPTLTLPIAANVKAGTAPYGNPTSLLTPSFSPNFPAVANVYNDTVNGVAGTLVLPAVGDVFTGIAYGPPGTSSTGTLTLASAANVRTGNGLFGRSGNSITPTLADCADAASGCFVVGPLQVTATVAGSADKILSGQTVGGIAGNITLPAVGKVFSGIQYGVLGTGKTGTLILPTATNVLAGSGPYGDPAALLTPSLTEDFPEVGNVLASDTVNNVAGTLTLPAPGNVLTASGTYGNPAAAVTPTLTLPLATNVKVGTATYGNPTSLLTPSFSPDFPNVTNVYNDTVDGMAGTLVLPAVGDVFTGIAYGPPGTSSTGTLTLASAANVRTGNGLFGRSGNSITPTLADCADAASGCFVVGPLQVTATVAGSADKILSGQTVGGILGNVALPAVGKVLVSTKYGVSGTAITGTLILPNAANVLTASGTYGDPGAAITPSFSPDFPAVANVLSTDTVNSVTGTLTLPAVGNVLTGTAYGVAGTGNTGTLTLPVATNVLTATGSYGDPAAAITPSYSPDFPAISNVLSTDTVNSVAGTLTLPAAGTVLTTTSYGVGGNGSTGTLTIPAAGNVLSTAGTYGNPGAAMTPTLTLPLATNVKVGTATYGNPSSFLTPSFSPDFPTVTNVYNDTVDGVAGTLVLPAAGDVFTGIAYGPPGTNSTGTLTLANASNVRSGNGLFGRSGNSITPTLADCTDGASGCFVVGPLQAAATIAGAGSKILSGQAVAGVAGNITLPAVGKVLTGIAYGVSGTGNTGTLTLPAGANVLTASGTFGDPAAAVTPSYSPDFPAVGNVLSTDTVNSVVGTLTLPVAGDVFTGTAYGVAGSGSTGTLTLATAANVRTGNGAFGRSGTSVTPVLADCSTDGGTSCVAVPAFKAADMTNVVAGNIKNAITIAAVTGNVTPAPANCAADGATACIAIANFPAVDKVNNITANATKIRAGVTIAGVAGTLSDCADGGSSCVTGPLQAAATIAGSASKILSGQSVAGVAGNITLPAVGKVLTGISYGVSGTGNTGTLTLPAATNVLTASGTYGDPAAVVTPSYSPDFPAVGNVLSTDTVNNAAGTLTLPATADVFTGISYGVGGAPSTGTLTLPTAANVRTIAGTYGRIGALITPALADCSADGATGCVTVTAFKAANMANVTAGNIRATMTIAGVAGQYPSSTFPIIDGTATTDLTALTQLTALGSFEFWDSSGVRHTGNGDADIVPANIKSGIAFENLGVTGAMAGTASCTADGESNGCATTTRFKAMDTDPSVITAWDIRSGKTAGGIAGNIRYNKNMAQTSATVVFNRTTGSGATAGTDPYDTIEDYNGSAGAATPADTPTGFQTVTFTNWVLDSTGDNGSGGGIANDGICNGTESCVYKDSLTGMTWSPPSSTTGSWETAITGCINLNAGGYASGWRLPTQKELMQAYIDGIWGNRTLNGVLSGNAYWSATTVSATTTAAWFTNLATGTSTYSSTAGYLKTDTALMKYVCVR